MAGIWVDVPASMSNVVVTNNLETLKFQWQFVTFTGEQQVEAEVRWRRLGLVTNIMSRMRYGDDVWSSVISVGRFEDRTTWTLSGGDMVPPVAANRRYSNMVTVDFPANIFTEGLYTFQVRMKSVDTAGTVSEWSGWSSHKIEIGPYDTPQDFTGSSPAQTKGPDFPTEGEYVIKVEAMSAAGVLGSSTDSNAFNVWETDRYLKESGGNVIAIPEHYHDSTAVTRVIRNP